MTTTLTAGSRRIPTRLGELHVEVTGDGPPAVLWHSMFVDSRSWQRITPELARRRTLILVDGPSSGASDPLTRTSSIAECATVAADVLDALHITGPVDWVGNAWGGHVGIQIAATRPERILTLVAIGTPTQPLDGRPRRNVRVLRPVYRLIGGRGPIAAGLLDALLTEATRANDPEAAEIVLGAFRRAGRAGMARAMQSFVLDRPDLSAAARAIDAPVRFIATDDRGEWTPAQATTMAAQMRAADVVIISESRALPNLEAPAAVVAAITEFWDDHSPPLMDAAW
jgi:pimeloyl-ACP methyl ester carboxylesterase